MIKTVIFYLLSIIILSTSLVAEDYGFEEDKQKHFSISALVSITGETILESYNKNSLNASNRLNGIELISYSTLIGLVPGLVKETLDSNEEDNQWSNADTLYDFTGALLGSTLSYSIHRLFDTEDYKVKLSLNQHEQHLYISYNF